jgi:3-hydroxyisobutyrate dehydrogenase-like beta-hydroxyacid dehydrogenase
MRVGFIGLGVQGAPMAERIAAAGFPLTVWARRESVRAEWAQRRVEVTATAAELGATCDVVSLCVTGDADVTSVTDDLLGSMRPGSVVLIHSTIAPQTCIQLGERAAKVGVEVLDAPVSGGPDAASAGKLMLMVGGGSAAFARVSPILRTFGDPVYHLGSLGNGLSAKIINNLVFIVNLAVAEHATRLGVALGIAPIELQSILQSGSARSLAGEVLDRIVTSQAVHVAGLFDKDLGLADALAHQAGVPTDDFLRLGEMLCQRLVSTYAI